MTKLMEQVVAEASKLPDAQQDELAAQILAELRDDQAWDASFEKTRPDQWEKLADRVRQQKRAGETKLLDPDAL